MLCFIKMCILIVGSVFSNVSILLIYYLNVKIFNFQNMTLGTNIQDI